MDAVIEQSLIEREAARAVHQRYWVVRRWSEQLRRRAESAKAEAAITIAATDTALASVRRTRPTSTH